MGNLVEVKKGSGPVVSSLVIAEQFGRRHDNVLQRLDKLKKTGGLLTLIARRVNTSTRAGKQTGWLN